MELKGASARHDESNDRPDQWMLTPELRELASRWGVEQAYATELKG